MLTEINWAVKKATEPRMATKERTRHRFLCLRDFGLERSGWFELDMLVFGFRGKMILLTTPFTAIMLRVGSKKETIYFNRLIETTDLQFHELTEAEQNRAIR